MGNQIQSTIHHRQAIEPSTRNLEPTIAMNEPTLRFICLVRDMRSAQKEYFTNIARAKKSKLPGDYAAAANALKKSKAYEIEVDRVGDTLLLQQESSPG